MTKQPASSRPQRWLQGANLYCWDSEAEAWRQVTTAAEWPGEDAIKLYMPLLRGLPEPTSYEWEEGSRRYRLERWPDRALEVLRSNDGRWRGRL